MKSIAFILASCGLISSAAAFGQEPGKKQIEIPVREIDLKDHLPAKAFIREPDELYKATAITNAEKLAQAFPNKEFRQRLAKQVDFTKEMLVLFAWEDSIREYKLAHTIDRTRMPPVVVFRCTGNSFASDAISYNAHLFVLPRGTAWRYFGK